MEFVQKQPSGNFLFVVLRYFIKCVITVQTTNNINGIRCALGRGGNKKFFFPDGREREKECNCVHEPFGFSQVLRQAWSSMQQLDSEPQS